MDAPGLHAPGAGHHPSSTKDSQERMRAGHSQPRLGKLHSSLNTKALEMFEATYGYFWPTAVRLQARGRRRQALGGSGEHLKQLFHNFRGQHDGLEYDLRTAGVLDFLLRVEVFCFSRLRVY